MWRITSGTWLPLTSSVSRLITEHGSAGKVMLMLICSGLPRLVSTKRCSLFLTVRKSASSMPASSTISTAHTSEMTAPVSVRSRNSCNVFG